MESLYFLDLVAVDEYESKYLDNIGFESNISEGSSQLYRASALVIEYDNLCPPIYLQVDDIHLLSLLTSSQNFRTHLVCNSESVMNSLISRKGRDLQQIPKQIKQNESCKIYMWIRGSLRKQPF